MWLRNLTLISGLLVNRVRLRGHLFGKQRAAG